MTTTQPARPDHERDVIAQQVELWQGREWAVFVGLTLAQQGLSQSEAEVVAEEIASERGVVAWRMDGPGKYVRLRRLR